MVPPPNFQYSVPFFETAIPSLIQSLYTMLMLSALSILLRKDSTYALQQSLLQE